MRPDSENVIRPVVDYVLSRPEVDPDRIALIGWSFGGYVAPGAASSEPRVAACIVDPGQCDPLKVMRAGLPLGPEARERLPEITPVNLSGPRRRCREGASHAACCPRERRGPGHRLLRWA